MGLCQHTIVCLHNLPVQPPIMISTSPVEREAIPTRIDLPALMAMLRCGDIRFAYEAGKVLARVVSTHEEHREALTAQQESAVAPLVCHLASGQVRLVHNATLLLGHCLMTNSEFRVAFGNYPGAAHQLVMAMGSPEPAVVVHATWAVRHFFSDPNCVLNDELLDLADTMLKPLLAHEDGRIQKHTSKLNVLVRQRREHLKATQHQREAAIAASPRSSAALAALTSINGTQEIVVQEGEVPQEEGEVGEAEERPSPMSAISALAMLTMQHDRTEDSPPSLGSPSESSPSSSPHSSP